MDEEVGSGERFFSSFSSSSSSFFFSPFFQRRFGVSRSPAVPDIVVDFFASKIITPDAIRNGTERHGPLKRSSRIKDK